MARRRQNSAPPPDATGVVGDSSQRHAPASQSQPPSDCVRSAQQTRIPPSAATRPTARTHRRCLHTEAVTGRAASAGSQPNPVEHGGIEYAALPVTCLRPRGYCACRSTGLVTYLDPEHPGASQHVCYRDLLIYVIGCGPRETRPCSRSGRRPLARVHRRGRPAIGAQSPRRLTWIVGQPAPALSGSTNASNRSTLLSASPRG
jgi:hypothetical protein